MLGLIKKDFLILKGNLKTMTIIFIVYLFLAFQETLDITLIIPILGIIMFVSTFSYDDFNNWNPYVITFPKGRENVVKAKYIATIILVIILAMISLILGIGIQFIKTNIININDIINSLMGTILSSVILISILYPIIFKYGPTKGRIVLFTVVFCLAGVGALISNFIDMNFIVDIINKLDNIMISLISLTSIILLSISYLVSKKIYLHKEF